MTIVVDDFRLEEFAESAEVSCSVRSEGFPPRLRFRIPLADADSVDLAEPNWAAIALYWQAMMTGRELVVEADLSPLLLHNMRGDLMALMRNYEPMLRHTTIQAGTSSPGAPDRPRAVVTGFSGGVDSLATLLLYSREEVPSTLRITALAVYQVGALGPTAAGEELLASAADFARVQADKQGLGLFTVWSNMDEIFEPVERFGPADFRRTVGLRNAAATMLLQNGIGTYLPSGSVSYRSATYGPYSCTENLDPVLQPLLETEKLRVLAAAAGLSRPEKIKLLADNPDAQARLNVCVDVPRRVRDDEPLNCTRCWKCVQTMMVLDALGRLDDFRKVFDVDLYLTNRSSLLRNLVNYAHDRGSAAILEQIEFARETGIPTPRPRGPLARTVRRAYGSNHPMSNMARRVVHSLKLR